MEKSARKPRTFLTLKKLETTQKKFRLLKESEFILSSYIRFLEETQNFKGVTEDSVIDALIEKLKKDKAFSSWINQKSS